MITLEQIKSFLKPFKGATSSTNGKSGIVPAPKSTEVDDYYLSSEGNWKKVDFAPLQEQIDTLDNTTVKLTGNQTISGQKTFSTGIKSTSLGSSPALWTTNPSQSNRHVAQLYQYEAGTENRTIIRVYQQGTTTYKDFNFIVNEDGTPYMSLPANPANSDNTTKVATTAWTRTNAVMKSGNETISGLKTFKEKSSGRNSAIRLDDGTTDYGSAGIELVQATSNGYNQFLVHFLNGNKYPFYINQDTSDSSKFTFTLLNSPNSDSNNTQIATTAWVRTFAKTLNTASLATNGWCKIPISGQTKPLIIQWGYQSAVSSGTITLPTAFTNTNYSLSMMCTTAGSGNGAHSSTWSSKTVSNFAFAMRTGSGGTAAIAFNWMAIGF